MQTMYQTSTTEQLVIGILRKLPPERVSQLVDFAQFLELQPVWRYGQWSDEKTTETEDEIHASEDKWDELFATPESKRLLRAMAREAREDYLAGRTSEIAITEDGRLAPA